MLKSNFFSKNKKDNEDFSKKEYKFLKPFFKLFLNIYILVLVISFVPHINLIHKVLVDLINEREQETHGLLSKKLIPWKT